jgi:hypothetical protein
MESPTPEDKPIPEKDHEPKSNITLSNIFYYFFVPTIVVVGILCLVAFLRIAGCFGGFSR